MAKKIESWRTKPPSINQFEIEGGVTAYKKAGMSQDKIMRQMYNVTHGMNSQERSEMVSKFFNTDDRKMMVEKYQKENG